MQEARRRLFINAAEYFEKGKRQNYMTDAHIHKIIETYQKRPREVGRYARRVEMKEIVEKGYNLNISRYVSTAEPESEVDLTATHANLVRIEEELRRATSEHNRFLNELGLPPIPQGAVAELHYDAAAVSVCEAGLVEVGDALDCSIIPLSDRRRAK